MKKNILKSKYHILVVWDQTKSSQIALQNAVNLAKSIDGSIELFYVKPLNQVVRYDNQLSAMRELNSENTRIEKTMKATVDHISETEHIPIIYDFTIGNVIQEVKKHIRKTQPDIVVLAKTKTKVSNVLGTDLASYLLKNFQGTLLISGNEKSRHPNNDITLGILDDFLAEDYNYLAGDLERSTAKPITRFKINTSENGIGKEMPATSEQEQSLHPNMTTFEFDPGANFSSSVAKYVQRSGVNLLCVRKSRLLDLNKQLKMDTRQIHKTIQKTDIPVLILES